MDKNTVLSSTTTINFQLLFLCISISNVVHSALLLSITARLQNDDFGDASFGPINFGMEDDFGEFPPLAPAGDARFAIGSNVPELDMHICGYPILTSLMSSSYSGVEVQRDASSFMAGDPRLSQ